MKKKVRVTVNQLTLGEAPLEQICQSEEKNLQNFKKVLAAELPYFDRLRQLHESAVDKISDDLLVPFQLMRDAGNSLIFSGITLLRGHMVEACAVSRRAVEAAAFAYKTRDPKKAKIWINEKTGAPAYTRELRGLKFPKNHVALNNLGASWIKLCDIGSHASIVSQVFRFELRDGKATGGYFDVGDQPIHDYRLMFNWLLGTHIQALIVFAEVLDKDISDEWKEKFRLFKEDYKQFTKRILPALQPKSRAANSIEEVTPGGIILPRPGDLAKLILRSGKFSAG